MIEREIPIEGVDIMIIEGVRYSTEVFRCFAAPDPNKFFQFVRRDENIYVTEFRIDEFESAAKCRAQMLQTSRPAESTKGQG